MPEKSAVQPSIERAERATVVGVVTSAKSAKTITVTIDRFVQHPVFGKFMKKTSTCYAHDEKGEAKEGDRVEIMSSRPLSKLKRWRLVRIVLKGARPIAPVENTAKPAPTKPVPAKPATAKKPAVKGPEAPPKKG
jgi:small subunit ribosomal protein S17